MRLTVTMCDGDQFTIAEFPTDDWVAMRKTLMEDAEVPSFVQLAMDHAVVLLATAEIRSVELE